MLLYCASEVIKLFDYNLIYILYSSPMEHFVVIITTDRAINAQPVELLKYHFIRL